VGIKYIYSKKDQEVIDRLNKMLSDYSQQTRSEYSIARQHDPYRQDIIKKLTHVEMTAIPVRMEITCVPDGMDMSFLSDL